MVEQEYAGKEKEIKKNRIIHAVLPVLLITVLAGCSFKLSDSHDTKPIVAPSESSTDHGSSETDEGTGGQDEEQELPTIEEQLCFSYEGLTVTAKSFTHDDFLSGYKPDQKQLLHPLLTPVEGEIAEEGLEARSAAILGG